MHGRERERRVLADLLDQARAGTAAALVLRGEAGVGKSALLEAVVIDAANLGMRVLRSQAMESESPLAFAGLHQLLHPLFADLDQLPDPQARALRVAFGQQDGAAIDPFAIALGILGLLSVAAERAPLLVVVDDAHWLDATQCGRAAVHPAPAAGRSRRGGPVRPRRRRPNPGGGGHPFACRSPGWTRPPAGRCSREHLGNELPDAVTRALLEQTGGNPLALLELPSALTSDQRAGIAPVPDHLQLTDRVQRVFLDRCRRLPEHVQTLLLVAAADDTGSLTVVQQATVAVGVPEADVQDAVRQAEQARLLVTDRDSVGVRHPLVRSAVYQAATGQERRSAHRALATVLGSTWPAGPAGLASRQRSDRPGRGRRPTPWPGPPSGPKVPAATQRPRLPTSVPPSSARPTPHALSGCSWPARNAWASGQAGRARTLAETARGLADDRILRADIDRLRARVEINVGSAVTAHHIFITAARSVVAEDPVRALEMRVAATLTHQFNADVPADAEAWPDAALPTDPRTRCLRQLLTATTADADHRWEEALPALSQAVELAGALEDLDVIANVGNAALHLGDDDGHRRCFTRMLGAARDRGALMSVQYALSRLAFADYPAGRWDRVRDECPRGCRPGCCDGAAVVGCDPARLADDAGCAAR